MIRIYGRYEIAEHPASLSGGPMKGYDAVLARDIVLYWWKPDAALFDASQDKANEALKEGAESDGVPKTCADAGFIYLVAPSEAAAQSALAKLRAGGLFPEPLPKPAPDPPKTVVLAESPVRPMIVLPPPPEIKPPPPQPVLITVQPRAKPRTWLAGLLIALAALAALAIAWLLWSPAPTITLHADHTVLTQGEPLHLEWTSTYADSVSIDPGLPSQPPRSDAVLYPQQSTTYTAVAKGRGGSASIRLQVLVDPPLFISFNADPPSLQRGQNTTLHWTVTGAEHVSIEPDIGSVEHNGTIQRAPTQRTVYKLTATRPSGRPEFREIPVDVTEPPPKVPDPPDIGFFTADPPSVQQCGFTTLGWKVANADTVWIDPLGPEPGSGSVRIPLAQSADFTLTAQGAGGQRVSPPLQVSVLSPPKTGPNHPPGCGEIVWTGYANAGERIVLQSGMGGNKSIPSASSISGNLPFSGVQVSAWENYVQVTGQPITLGLPKVIFSSSRSGRPLTVHLLWEIVH